MSLPAPRYYAVIYRRHTAGSPTPVPDAVVRDCHGERPDIPYYGADARRQARARAQVESEAWEAGQMVGRAS